MCSSNSNEPSSKDRGINLVAFAFDQFLDTIHEKQEAFIVDITKVPSSQPSSGIQSCSSCFVIANVTYARMMQIHANQGENYILVDQA